MSRHAQANEFDGVMVNGEEYELVSQVDAQHQNKPNFTWSLKAAAKKETMWHLPKNVREGEIANEFIATYDNWHMGLVGDGENRLGGLHLASGIHGLVPGALKFAHAITTVTHTTEENTRPVWSGAFNGEFFVVAGQYCKRYANGVQTIDRNFGAGIYATDAIVWGVGAASYLLVCFGGSTNIIQWRNAAGTWNTVLAGGLVYADHFTKVMDRLHRASGNGVSSIANGADPTLLVNWSSSITVGDSAFGGTDLNAVGVRWVLSKPEGLFFGDANALDPNVLPHLENAPDARNGRNTFVRGTQIFYQTPFDTLLYDTRSESVESIGLQHSFPNAGTADNIPSTYIRAMCSEGVFVWAVTGSGDFPRVRPTGVKKTTDGATYTDYGIPFAADLSNLSTVANNDWLIVGFAAGVSIYGLVLELSATNSNASTMTVEYWNGSAWTGFAVVDDVWDGTRVNTLATPMVDGTKSLERSGVVTWVNGPTTVASTIDGLSAHWYRVSFSADLDATTTLASVWGITNATTPASGSAVDAPGSWLFRGRAQQPEDNAPTSFVWEPYAKLAGDVRPNSLAFIPGSMYPHTRRYGSLAIAGKQTVQFISPPTESVDEPYSDLKNYYAWAMGPFDDMGSPNVSKYFLSVTSKLRNGSQSSVSPALKYRVGNNGSWTAPTGSPATIINASGTQFQIGYWSDLRVFALSAGGASSGEAWPEWFEVEVRYRLQPSVKHDWQMLLRVPVGGATPADVQITNLEALQNSSTATFVDKLRRPYTVTVEEVGAAALYEASDGSGLAYAVPVRVVEA